MHMSNGSEYNSSRKKIHITDPGISSQQDRLDQDSGWEFLSAQDLSLSALPPLPYKVLSRPPPTSPNLQIHRQDTTTIYYKDALPKSKRESEITSSHVKPDTLNKDGILPLINRGYFHPSLDFTPAFRVASTSPPLLSQQIQCHPSDKRSDRRSYLEKFKIDESLRWKFNVTNHAGENLDLKSTVDTDQNQFADDLERLTKTPFPSISNLNDGEDACGEGAEKTIILHIVSSRTLRDHPAFQVFAERCPSTLWDSVLSLLSLLEEMALQYSLPLIMVDSEALVKMASKPAIANYSISDLLTSCVNHNQLISLMKQPGRLYLASNKHRRRDAALKIQKCWRGYVQRKIYLHNADLKNAARVVVEFRKRCLARRAWLKQQAQQRQRYFELCDMMLESFKQNWGILQNTNRRLHIHLPSFSHPLRIRPNFKDPSFLQQMQIGRLYELVHNPKMECIYITQQRFTNEFDTLPGSSAHNDETIEDEWWELVKSYLPKTAFSRLHLLHPETHERFPKSSSLAASLWSSPFTLRKILDLTKGKELNAVIIPYIPSEWDWITAASLAMPIVGLLPSHPRKLLPSAATCSSPQGQPYQNVTQAMLESATHKLPRLHTVWGIREKELFFRVMLQCLVSGIEECRDVWFLKVADEVEGRGVWVFDATKLSFYKDITSIVRQANMRDIDEFVGTEQYSRFMQTLESEIDEIAVPLYPNMTGYSDWNSFLISFIASGGIIQSCPALRNRAEAKLTFPTLHAMLEPDGKLKLVGSHEKIFTKSFSLIATLIPQRQTPLHAMMDQMKLVARHFFEAGFVGYISVDFVGTLRLEDLTLSTLSVVDIKPHFTCPHSIVNIYQIITQTYVDYPLVDLASTMGGVTSDGDISMADNLNSNDGSNVEQIESRRGERSGAKSEFKSVNADKFYSSNTVAAGDHSATEVAKDGIKRAQGFTVCDFSYLRSSELSFARSVKWINMHKLQSSEKHILNSKDVWAGIDSRSGIILSGLVHSNLVDVKHVILNAILISSGTVFDDKYKKGSLWLPDTPNRDFIVRLLSVGRTGSSAVETALTTLAIVYQRSRTFDEQSRKCNFLEIAEELADLLKVTKRWDRLDEDGNSDTIVSNIDVAYSDCANRPNQVELSTLPASLTIPGKTNRVIPKSPSASHNDRFLSFVSTVIALPSEVASEITTQDTESEETKDIHNQLSALKSTLKCEAALLAQELKTADKRKCVLQEINTELINEITILKQKEIEFQDKLEDRLKEKREKRQRGRKNRNEIRDARIPEESNFGENCDELEDDEEDSDNESSDDETHVNGTGESAKDHDKDLEGEGKNNKAVKILQNMFKDIHMFSSKSN